MLSTTPLVGHTTGRKRSDGLYAWSVNTQHISVTAAPQYLHERSSPEQLFYLWAYHISIQNHGHVPVRLLSRQWIITDGSGHVETVAGDGVVGEQPWINPGQIFDYQSCCPLRTPTGNMRGWYHFSTQDGESFKARIPLFFLRSENLAH